MRHGTFARSLVSSRLGLRSDGHHHGRGVGVMRVVFGLLVIALSTLCWGGQVLSWLVPARAVQWGLAEADAEVEPVLAADGAAEARWDAVALWPMIVAGVLLVADRPAWPYFGLVGGGSYVYFAGRGILARVVMRRAGFRVGTQRNVMIGMVALTAWGIMAATMIVAAVVALQEGT